MPKILPQQELLLELLVMSGDIAVGDDMEGTILFRTLTECETQRWVTQKRFGAGFNKLSITNAGRAMLKGSPGQ